MKTTRQRLAAVERPARWGLAVAGICAAAVLGGCGSSSSPAGGSSPTPTVVVPQQPAPTGSGPHFASLQAIADALNAKGVDCSNFVVNDANNRDPGAAAQGHCGASPIEIATFASSDDMERFRSNLGSFVACSPGQWSTIFVKGDTWAVYSNDYTTTQQIAAALGTTVSATC